MCVPLEECTCIYEGQEYGDGDTWVDGCEHCLCKDAKPECAEKCNLTEADCAAKVC